MQQVLANLLKTHAPLVALVGSKIDWDAAPQGSALPYIVMYVASGVTDYNMAGASGYAETRVQFDCRGASAAQARAVAEAVEAKLSGYSGTYGGYVFQGVFAAGQRTRNDKDGPTTWYTDSRDFVFHWMPV